MYLKHFGGFLILFIFSGCLYSTHHFNAGRVLSSGQTRLTAGVGPQLFWSCSGGPAADSLESIVCRERTPAGRGQSVEKQVIPKASINYRLGIRDKWGVFPGAELGWHLELPTSPATMEFELKLALPRPETWRMYHNISLGWGVGVWADNSFFAEYAQSKFFWDQLLFYNLRATWLATQLSDVMSESFDSPFAHNQRFIFQSAAGIQLQLPDWPVIPDVLIPQGILTFPQVPTGDKKYREEDIGLFDWGVNLGMGWEF